MLFLKITSNNASPRLSISAPVRLGEQGGKERPGVAGGWSQGGRAPRIHSRILAGVPAYPPDSMPQARRHSGTRATKKREPDGQLGYYMRRQGTLPLTKVTGLFRYRLYVMVVMTGPGATRPLLRLAQVVSLVDQPHNASRSGRQIWAGHEIKLFSKVH